MSRNFLTLSLCAAASALVFAACATTAPETDSASTGEIVAPEELSKFALAMETVDQLEANGNTQTAIDRLTQLLGDDTLKDSERAIILSRRGQLRSGPNGYDLWGAIGDYRQVLDDYPATPEAIIVQPMLDVANGEATSLNSLLELPETSRTQRFQALFRLGQHDDALDLMLSSGLQPKNDYLIAMYQIGYLCAGEDQTGPAYSAIEPDGTRRELRFCDFGK